MAYRITPHTATKVAPADLMYQRKIRHGIPDVDTTVNKTELNEQLESNDHIAKLQAKVYQDTRTHAKPNTLQVGDRVLVKQRKLHKVTPRFNTNPYYITDMKGTLVTASNPTNHHEITRNTSHFKPIPETAVVPRPFQPEEGDDEVREEEAPSDRIPVEPVQSRQHEYNDRNNGNNNDNNENQRKQYPRRQRKPTHEWRKY